MTSSIRASAGQAGPVDRGPDRDRAELHRGDAGQRAAELADGCPGRADDVGVTRPVRAGAACGRAYTGPRAAGIAAYDGPPRTVRGGRDRRRGRDRTPTRDADAGGDRVAGHGTRAGARRADARARLPRRRDRPRHRQPARRDPRVRVAARRRRAHPFRPADRRAAAAGRGRPHLPDGVDAARAGAHPPADGAPDRDRAGAAWDARARRVSAGRRRRSRSTCRPTSPRGTRDPSVVRQWVATALVEAVEALGWPTAHGRLRISGSERGSGDGGRRSLRAGGRDRCREPGGHRPPGAR